MKTSFSFPRCAILILAALLDLACPVQAQLTINSPTLNLSIPDNDLVGASETLTVPSGSPAVRVTDVTVTLNLSGDWLGDLYVQLTHNGEQAVLLNRVGRTTDAPFGYDDTAIDVQINDAAPQGDIHSYRVTLGNDPSVPLSGPLTGTWAPDGRNVSPTSVLNTDSRTATLGNFVAQDPTGDWRLLVADVDPGGQNTLVSWGVQITTTAVPEPEGWTLAAGSVCLLVAVIGRARRFGLWLLRGAT